MRLALDLLMKFLKSFENGDSTYIQCSGLSYHCRLR
jgi:hypothetical protein